MLYIITTIFVLCILSIILNGVNMSPVLTNQSVDLKERVQIAGLFTVHFRKRGNVCSDKINPVNYQMVEAMKFAVEEINNDKHILPSVQLDYFINDTCGIVKKALEICLSYSFVSKHFTERRDICSSDRNESGKAMVKTNNLETVAIVGPYSSEETRDVTDFVELFRKPVIGPTATSTLLSDKYRFKHFYRTVPSDKYQVKAVIGLLKHFGWNFIILLVSEDEYGRSARLAFKEAERDSQYSFCTEVEEVLNQNNIEEIYEGKISKTSKAKVIVMFASLDVTKEFLNYAQKQNMSLGFTFIASDGWNRNKAVIEGKEMLLKGMLGISPYEGMTLGFKDYYMKQLQRVQQKRQEGGDKFTKWRKSYFSQVCKSNITNCPDISLFETSSTFNVVKALASALHEILNCSNVICEKAVKNVDWSELNSILKKTKYVDVDNETVHFEESMNTRIKYTIWNLQEVRPNEFQFVEVAKWEMLNNKSEGHFELLKDKQIKWNDRSSKPPISNCRENCQKGSHKVIQEYHAQCCWNCSQCEGNTFTDAMNQAQCLPCPDGYWANNDHTGCTEFHKVYLRLQDVWVIILLGCSGTGIFALLLTVLIFLYYSNTPVIKACSRSLCYVIMLGLAALFVLPVMNIERPTELRCKLYPVYFGMAMVLNVGTLLIKTNRISRIFSRKIFKNGKVRCLSLSWQYFMIIVLVSIEIGICAIWEFLLVPPRVQFEDQKEQRLISCTLGNELLGFVIWAMYNTALVILCTYQAFLVRKVPTNYSEAKFIFFTMITICICFVVYIPVHFGTVVYYKELVASFLYVFAGCVEFLCLFFPKLYIVLLRPDKNKPMEQVFESPLRNKRISQYFEADFDYFPTQNELDLLKMDNLKKNQRKRDYLTAGKPRIRNGFENNSHSRLSQNCNLSVDISSATSSVLPT